MYLIDNCAKHKFIIKFILVPSLSKEWRWLFDCQSVFQEQFSKDCVTVVLCCVWQSQRSQTEAVTFLANHDDSRALYAIPGTQPSQNQSEYSLRFIRSDHYWDSIKWDIGFFFFQVWIMWAMKTSCPITLQSRLPSSTSCLSASSCTTLPNVNMPIMSPLQLLTLPFTQKRNSFLHIML